MKLPKYAILLRIFIGEDHRYENRPLYEAIVQKARETHLAGATVIRGPMGYGHASRLHTEKILRLSYDLPLIIEIVESEEKINGFLPVLEPMMGMVWSRWRRYRSSNMGGTSRIERTPRPG